MFYLHYLKQWKGTTRFVYIIKNTFFNEIANFRTGYLEKCNSRYNKNIFNNSYLYKSDQFKKVSLLHDLSFNEIANFEAEYLESHNRYNENIFKNSYLQNKWSILEYSIFVWRSVSLKVVDDFFILNKNVHLTSSTFVRIWVLLLEYMTRMNCFCKRVFKILFSRCYALCCL